MGKRAYINDGNDNWIPLVSSLPNMDAYATVEYVNGLVDNIDLSSASAAAVTYLVDSAPGALDTLNELSAALNDDANFSSTVTTSIGEKLSISTASSIYLTQVSASTNYATKAELNEKASTGKAIAMAIVFG